MLDFRKKSQAVTFPTNPYIRVELASRYASEADLEEMVDRINEDSCYHATMEYDEYELFQKGDMKEYEYTPGGLLEHLTGMDLPSQKRYTLDYYRTENSDVKMRVSVGDFTSVCIHAYNHPYGFVIPPNCTDDEREFLEKLLAVVALEELK